MTEKCDSVCTSTTGPNFTDPDSVVGNGVAPGCVKRPGDDTLCPTTNVDPACKPFQLDQNRDACYIDQVVNEALNIGGASMNIYKLLGVHEQGKLVDCIGKGQAISGGDIATFPASNAFDVYITEWRSIQRGDGVVASSYVGYDFGEIKTNDDTRRMYGVDTSIFRHITAFAIKQSSDSTKRVTRARLERSQDGIKWYGVSIVNLPDDDCLNTILTKHSVISRYWRLRPVTFGGGDGDWWGVQAFQMFHDYAATEIGNVQDKIFFENRDRDYSTDSLLIKGSYDMIDVTTDLSRFGIELPTQSFYLQVGFSACVAVLGRPLIIGDVIEMPSEAQYSASMERVEKWMEVTDVAWSTEGYTPGWQPTMLRVILQPAYATQETQDIFGDLGETADATGLMDQYDGNNKKYQDFFDMSETAEAESKRDVPENGREGSSTIRAWEESEVETALEQGLPHLNKIGLNPIGLYVEDAMPPNNAPFTEGTEYPTTGVSHGDYHRLTYEGLSKDVPARLFRYSETKNRWVFLEKDRRAEFSPTKPRLQEFLTSPTKRPHDEILRDKDEDCEDE